MRNRIRCIEVSILVVIVIILPILVKVESNEGIEVIEDSEIEEPIVYEELEVDIEVNEIDIVEEAEPIVCPYTEDELSLLAKVIYAEAGGCKEDITLYYVGSVVLNRVSSDLYEDNIHDVVYSKHWGIQYACAYNGALNKDPDERCIEIATELLDTWYETGETYLPDNVLGQAGFKTLNGEYCRSEGIIFSYY